MAAVASRVDVPLEGQVPVAEILGLNVHSLRSDQLTALLIRCVEGGIRGWFASVNVHAANLAFGNPAFRAFFERSLINYCDGEGIRWGSMLLGCRLPERIALTDWIHQICRVAESRGYRIFLLGGRESIAAGAAERLRSLYPNILIVGTHHGYDDGTEERRTVRDIREVKPDILIVGMGMPKQEFWLQRNFSSTGATIGLNAGGCFDYLSGARPRCPHWMGRMGLEWLYRLTHEPRRLWGRYLIGNPAFILQVLRQRTRMR